MIAPPVSLGTVPKTPYLTLVDQFVVVNLIIQVLNAISPDLPKSPRALLR